MKATYICDNCGDDIYFDEDCLIFGNYVLCKGCVHDLTTSAPMPEEL